MSIPLILASKSKPRRYVLNSAGVCPTIRVSHVDEDAALERAAASQGREVADLDVNQRVMILAQAKAQAVYHAYRDVAATAAAAQGERVIGYPLKGALDAQQRREPTHARHARPVADGAAIDYSRADVAQTRDFSGVDFPTTSEPIDVPVAGQPGLTCSEVGPLILGCDSLFLLDGVCQGKPHTVEVARERLRAMRGASGELWTGHCLIDFASGRAVQGASRAVVRFADYSDEDIERYLATGEPLEVAGSFTLEGFGGAFIDGIEGDPHGVIGVSLPLVRRLCGKLGIAWPDLWNVGRGVEEPEGKAEGVAWAAAAARAAAASGDSGANGAAGGDRNSAPRLGGTPREVTIVPPAENVHQPGDGWIDCACGRKHWGVNGASGVLLARRDPATGAVTHVVMQHRAAWSAEGGTWGIPGGATADGESPIEGALRESFEEANITPADIEVVGSYREDHGPWAYTTVFAFEKPGHEVRPRANDDESMEIEWVPIDEVPDRKLLTAMRTDWPRFAARLASLAEEHRGR
ncbi:Maf family protein [Bifidobacterium pullorum subsp. saeculare]|uniref:Nucleoside triphosphate pyrophosphatase n=1 Tax=Bifidobacterium pullorum subsp. saeculare TaxID=78257 RepID=A0A938WVW1_9BIFI|nr:Maf family protein [Bifidobacterium pullorum subsp. saeculare]